jgi:hypothetical protein
MKSNVKSSLYFSAYPLKAIKDPSPVSGIESPAVLATTGHIKTSRIRISPMANPYKQPIAKPVNPATGTGSPYLRAVLAGTGNIKTTSRVRVYSMVTTPGKQAVSSKQANKAKDIEASGEEWFNHYE